MVFHDQFPVSNLEPHILTSETRNFWVSKFEGGKPITKRHVRDTLQSFSILAILSFTWQKLNPVYLQSPCQRNFSVSFYFLGFSSIFNPTGVPLKWRDTASLLSRPVYFLGWLVDTFRSPKPTFFWPRVMIDDPTDSLWEKRKQHIEPDLTHLKYFSPDYLKGLFHANKQIGHQRFPTWTFWSIKLKF